MIAQGNALGLTAHTTSALKGQDKGMTMILRRHCRAWNRYGDLTQGVALGLCDCEDDDVAG